MSLTKVTYSMIQGAPINVLDYGVVGGGTVDDAPALQAAFNAAVGKTTIVPAGTYRCNSGLHIKGTLQAHGVIFMFYGSVFPYLMYQDSEGDLTGFILDGTNVTSCVRGLAVYTDFAQTKTGFYNLKVQNLSNTDNTQSCNGAAFYQFSNATHTSGKFDVQIDVENVLATANGIIGDEGGSATGISMGANGTTSDMFFNIHDCTVKNIRPSEDAIGFYAYTGNHTLADAKGLYIWSNCRCYESEKYAYKIQAQNTTLYNCYAENLIKTSAEQFTVYGYNTTIERCTSHVRGLGSGYSYATHGRKNIILNCKAFNASLNPIIGVYAPAENVQIIGCYFESQSTTAGQDDPVFRLEPCANLIISDNICYKTFTTGIGTVFEFNGTTNSILITNHQSVGYYRTLYAAYSGGQVTVRNSSLSGVVGITGLGTDGQSFTISDTIFTGSNGVLINEVADISVDIDNCVFNAPVLGVVGTVGKTRITNSIFNSTTAASGTAIVCSDVVARNNKINKFLNGIDYRNSTIAEVADNCCVGTANPYLTAGVTPFVAHNNDSR